MSPHSPTGSGRACFLRPAILFLAALGLLAGLWAGLLCLGWAVPPLSVRLPAAHGPLMVTGFLGTQISLERAVALGAFRASRGWACGAPLLAGLSVGALLIGLPLPVVQALALRVAADLAGQSVLRRWGGLLNEVAILLFLGMMVAGAIRARQVAARTAGRE